MIQVTEHAILRYQERVKPAHPFWKARNELEVLARMADPKSGLPDWYEPREGQVGEGWLELADGIAGLLLDGSVTTVVCRGGAQPGTRERKNKRKASKRAAKRLKNRAWHQKRQYDRRRDAAWD